MLWLQLRHHGSSDDEQNATTHPVTRNTIPGAIRNTLDTVTVLVNCGITSVAVDYEIAGHAVGITASVAAPITGTIAGKNRACKSVLTACLVGLSANFTLRLGQRAVRWPRWSPQ